MSSRKDSPERPKTSRRRKRRSLAAPHLYQSAARREEQPEASEARAHFHREKERRAARVRPHDHPLEQARRSYQALLASEAQTARGGRPRKVAARKPAAAPEG